MHILIVTTFKLNDKPEKYFPNDPLVASMKKDGNMVSILHADDDDTYLANYLNESNEPLFQEIKAKRLVDVLNNIDVIYFVNPSTLAFEVVKAASKLYVPMICEFISDLDDKQNKDLYKKYYRYMNAIHYLDKSQQNELERLIKRRTNGHIYTETTKVKDMIVQYGDEKNHSPKKKFYYSDEINDDFALNKIEVKKSKKIFKYVHTNPFWIVGGILAYFIIARPLIFFLNKIGFHQRIRNKHILKKNKFKGYFIYSNHTQGMADAFTPNLLSPKRNYIVVSRETVSIPGLKGIVTMLGAIPIYSKIEELEPFNECIKKRIKQGKSVTIYPEAHIWPYYTKIRHFKKDSFRFPVDLNAPVYVLTNTWQKRRFSKKVKLVSYLSGPLLPDESLGRSEAMEDLKERVYFEMIKVTRSVKQVEKNQYIKVNKE